MSKLPAKRFHLIFSLVMGTMMVTLMTFVITAVNVGFPSDFLRHWGRAFLITYVVAIPVIYYLAPIARKITGRFVHLPG